MGERKIAVYQHEYDVPQGSLIFVNLINDLVFYVATNSIALYENYVSVTEKNDSSEELQVRLNKLIEKLMQ